MTLADVIAGREPWAVVEGDCLAVLPTLPDGCVDCVVTDPPYELGFMGKAWDRTGVAFQPETWQAALRTVRPGGYLLAFGGTRTYHRLTCAVEGAGWEIRDCVMWLYGSGFPKSLDISKAIDKQRDDLADVLQVTRWLNAVVKRAGKRHAEILTFFGFNEGSGQVGHWTALSAGGQPAVPTWDQWLRLKDLLGLGDDMDAEVWRLNGRKGKPGDAWCGREVIGQRTTGIGTGKGSTAFIGDSDNRDITAPATEAAKRWDGWGTALKPAWEPIVVARRPLDGTVAENVLRYGTGGLNIDACRLPTTDRLGGGHCTNGQQMSGGRRRPWMDDPEAVPANAARSREAVEKAESLGRWPANVAHDGSDEVMEALAAFDDAGTPARLFYCAKATREERGPGNRHPTVKPAALMSWLVRLVCPPGGVVLDPFCGSGTTGVACRQLGRRFAGVELSPEYAALARRRIADAAPLADLAERNAAPAEPTLFPEDPQETV